MNVLVVAAHPDDEVLGCGGTIARHVQAGDKVSTLFMSEGVSSRFVPGQDIDFSADIESREKASRDVATFLGCEVPVFLRMANLRMMDMAMLDVVKEIEAVVEDVQPNIIYTHHGGDLNSDHRVTHEAVMTACRPMEDRSVQAIYTFETPSSTEWSTVSIGDLFVPNRYVNIEEQMDIKLKALAYYDMELRPFPHPRSPQAITVWAQRHGATVGRRAAEAFCTIREIVG